MSTSPVLPNAFDLNLNTLKAQAKRRLKQLKANHLGAWQTLYGLDRRFASRTPDTIQLADVQWAIAKEHHASSWPALKQHVERLQQHRDVIAKGALSSQGVAALDNDKATMHIRCGHDVQTQLQQAGFVGECIAWIEPYSTGPLSDDPDKLAQAMAAFVGTHYLSEVGVDSSPAQLLSERAALWASLIEPSIERRVIWVEHDSYDQFMLVYLLANLPESALRTCELIQVGDFPGSERFIGLGQLSASALRSLWDQRQKVTSVMQAHATRVWRALCADTPDPIQALLDDSQALDLPYIKPALERHLQELPDVKTGLGLTQRTALKLLAAQREPMTVQALFSASQACDPLPFLGDLMFWAKIKPLTEGEEALIEVVGEQKEYLQRALVITEHGREF